MKTSTFLVVAMALSTSAFAQDKPEKMEVTDSRIPRIPAGPIPAVGPVKDPTGCIEKDCGMDPEDPSGSVAITQAQKNEQNKKAREKAKKEKGKLADNMKGDSLVDLLLGWLKGATIDASASGWFEVTYGKLKVKGGGCLQNHARLNEENPQEAKDYCVERKADTELVKKANGQFETQLNLTYTIYDTCYWEKKCGVQYITFISGSEAELKSFLNETIGEQYY